MPFSGFFCFFLGGSSVLLLRSLNGFEAADDGLPSAASSSSFSGGGGSCETSLEGAAPALPPLPAWRGLPSLLSVVVGPAALILSHRTYLEVVVWFGFFWSS